MNKAFSREDIQTANGQMKTLSIHCHQANADQNHNGTSPLLGQQVWWGQGGRGSWHAAAGAKTARVAMENEWRVLDKLPIQLPYGPAIPILGIFPKEMKQGLKEISAPPSSWSIIHGAKTWKQTQCPWMDDGERERVPCAMDHYSASRKKDNAIIFNSMDGPGGHYGKQDREGQIRYGLAYMWNLKKTKQKELRSRVNSDRMVVLKDSGAGEAGGSWSKGQTSTYKTNPGDLMRSLVRVNRKRVNRTRYPR